MFIRSFIKLPQLFQNLLRSNKQTNKHARTRTLSFSGFVFNDGPLLM